MARIQWVFTDQFVTRRLRRPIRQSIAGLDCWQIIREDPSRPRHPRSILPAHTELMAKSSHDRYAQRREQLRPILRAAEADLFLVTGEVNVKYLTGFTGDSSYLVVGPGIEIVITDSRYTTQLKEECPGLELHVRKVTEKLMEATVAVLKQAKRVKVGFESHLLAAETHEYLKTQLPTIDFRPISGKIESELRAIKDEQEIAETRQAVQQAERAFDLLRASLTPETTELEASWELERAVRMFGGSGMAFPPIVAVGDRAALPHYRPQRYAVKEAGLLLVDWGAQTFAGYRSDLTRTLFTQPATRKFEKVYQTVLKAQERAIKAIRPGVKCNFVDGKARGFIADAGFGKWFGHGLGHGIGLEIHEQPRFAPTSETELRPGMIVTVEPGIYLPGQGGVRIEDDVLVTADGGEVLSSTPKSLDAMRMS
jgi:Xaa-Pro aminopeptidase